MNDELNYISCCSVEGEAVAITSLATLGRFFMIWAGSVFNVYIQELFPTSLR